MNLLKTAKAVEKDLTKARDKKCEPIAQEIIQIIAKAAPVVKDVSKDWGVVVKEYGPIQVQINRLMKERGVTFSEVGYIWSIVQMVIDGIKRLSTESVAIAGDMAQKNFWGSELGDVTLSKIDEVLQSQQK